MTHYLIIIMYVCYLIGFIIQIGRHYICENNWPHILSLIFIWIGFSIQTIYLIISWVQIKHFPVVGLFGPHSNNQRRVFNPARFKADKSELVRLCICLWESRGAFGPSPCDPLPGIRPSQRLVVKKAKEGYQKYWWTFY